MSSDNETETDKPKCTEKTKCPDCGSEDHDSSKSFTFLGPDVGEDAGPKMKAWEARIKPLLAEILKAAEEEGISFYAHSRCDVVGDMVSGASTLHMRPGDMGIGVAMHGVATGEFMPVPRHLVAAMVDMSTDGPEDGALLN